MAEVLTRTQGEFQVGVAALDRCAECLLRLTDAVLDPDGPDQVHNALAKSELRRQAAAR
jgi:hypothetical protein